MKSRAVAVTPTTASARMRIHVMRSNPGPPMSLANMRANGVRAVTATCEACNHSADVNVDALPETRGTSIRGGHMRNLKRRIACRIASLLVPEQRIEMSDIRHNSDGSVSAEHSFRSLKDARRFQRFRRPAAQSPWAGRRSSG